MTAGLCRDGNNILLDVLLYQNYPLLIKLVRLLSTLEPRNTAEPIQGNHPLGTVGEYRLTLTQYLVARLQLLPLNISLLSIPIWWQADAARATVCPDRWRGVNAYSSSDIETN